MSKQLSGITFEVDSVEPIEDSFKVMPSFDAIDEYVRSLPYPIEFFAGEIASRRKRLETMPNSDPSYENYVRQMRRDCNALPRRSVEACSRYGGELCAHVSSNPLMESLAGAYRNHLPLSLSPDMIWIAICQGVAYHVNNHSEELRHRFVRHEGTVPLEVQSDTFFRGSLDNDWPSFVDALAEQLNDYLIEGVGDQFTPRFSTTGRAERMAAQTCLLEAVQSYFEVPIFKIICGIPRITLEGEANDWISLAERVESFANLELDGWLDGLRPILREFANASRGEIDRAFWQSIYRYRKAVCSNDMVHDQNCTGWVLAFFPYLTDRFGRPTRRNPWLADPDKREWLIYHRGPLAAREDELRQTRRMLMHRRNFERGIIMQSELEKLELNEFAENEIPIVGVYPDQIPNGVSRLQFIWTNQSKVTQQPMELLSGFLGISQDPTSLALRPYIGWAVRRTDVVA